MSGDIADAVAVGMDIGSWNARVATYDESLDHPVIVNNHDGNRFTRAVVEDQNVLDLLGNGDNPEGVQEFIDFILQLASDAVHQPLSKLRLVLACSKADLIPKIQERLPKNTCIGLVSPAAAVCLAYEAEPKCENILVVDGGASGLKVSLVNQTTSSDSSIFSIVQHETNTNVSGPHLMEELGKHVAQQFETKNRFPKGEVWSSKKVRGKLLRHCESALATMAQSANTATIHVDGLYEGMDCQVTVSKPRWEMLSGPLANQAKETMKRVVGTTEVDTVLLSGNLHAWLRPICESLFSGSIEPANFDISEAVALGCAKQAYWNLQNETTTMESTMPVKLSPVSIVGMEQDEETSIISKGTPLPAFGIYKPTSACSLWQVEPSRKQLATIDNIDSESQSLRVQLSETGQLSIAVGGDIVRIG